MPKKKLMILLSSLIVLIVLGGGAFFYIKDSGEQPEDPTSGEGAEDALEEAAEAKRINFPLENFVVNLADPGGRRYLSTAIVLELENKEMLPSLEKKIPEIRDRILMILPTQTFKDIQSVDGKDSLRNTLIGALNSVLSQGKITNIYFQEFVVQ